MILTVSSCIFDDGKITVTRFGGGGSGVALAKVNSVSIVNDQLVVNGTDLNGVTGVRITGPSSFDESFSIESKSAANLIANGLGNVAFAMNGLFNLILTDAQGAATFQVTFTLQDGAVTASKLADMGAGVGQILKYNGTTWVASDLSALTYAGNWNGTANTPDLSSGGSNGEYYIVNNAGTFDLSGGPGTNSWAIGDWVVWNNVDGRWEKVDNATNVTSFNSRSGVVTPQTGDYTWAQINKTSSVLSEIADIDAPAGDGSDTGKVLKWNNATSRWELADDLSGGGAGSVSSTEISDGAIVDADVNGAAAIAQSKIANLTTDLAAKVPLAGGTMTGDLTVPNLITAGNVDGVDVSALNTTVGTNTTNIGNNATAIGALDTDDVSEATNLYFTDARAKASSVINSTAGTETDQAASVAAMKSFVSGEISSFGSGDITDGGNTNAATVTIGTNDANSLALETNDTTAMTILSDGNVGIGTASPSRKLHVRSDGAYQLRLENGSAGGGFWNISQSDNTFGTGGGKLLFVPDTETSTNATVTFDNSGNVGIGTTAPNRLLEVAGPVRVSATALPGSPAAGDIAIDSADSNKLKWYNGSGWQDAGAASGTITSIGVTAPVATTGGTTPTLSMAQANGGADGYLDSADWTTFNNKQDALPTGGTTAQYVRGDLTLATLQDDVRSTLLTGYSSGAGTVAATDTIVQAVNKLDGNTAANTSAISALNTNAILDGGNTNAANVVVGTNDANSLELEVNGSTAMTILPDGSVGVGETNPRSLLQVGTGINMFTAGGSDNSHIARNLYFDGSNYRRTLADNDSSLIYMGGNSKTAFFTNDDSNTSIDSIVSLKENFTILTNGSVGINNAAPQSLLSAKGTLSKSLTGTVDVTSGTAAVTGTGTSFDTELNVGDAIKIESEVFTISAIANATNLTLDSTHTAGASGVTATSDPTILSFTNGDNTNLLNLDKSGLMSLNGILALQESSGSDVINIRSPSSIAASYTLTLPTTDGASGEVLTTDGSGSLSWAPAEAATSVSAGTGAAGTPSMSFSTDSNTGFYSSGPDQIGVTTNGTNTFNFTSTALTSPNTGGGNITTANGTAAAPTFSFTGDEDTGWFRAAADELAASTNGTERIRIDSAGNIGIGTTSPDQKLHVSESGATPLKLSRPGSVLNTNIEFNNDSGSVFAGAYGSNFAVGATANLGLSPWLFISSGNVGIGTTTPTSKLTINTTSYLDQFSLLVPSTSTTGGWARGMDMKYQRADTSEHRLLHIGILGAGDVATGSYFSSIEDSTAPWSTDAQLFLHTNGNVGIGTTSPDELLSLFGGQLSFSTSGGVGNNERAFIEGAYDAGGANYGGALLFSTTDGSNVRAEKMRIDKDGNVGIGTTNPQEDFHVLNNSQSAQIIIETPDGVGNSYNQISMNSNGTPKWLMGHYGDTNSNSSARNDFYIWQSTDQNDIAINQARFLIDDSGNVGIGTNAPVSPLDVTTNFDNSALTSFRNNSMLQISNQAAVAGSTAYFRTEVSLDGYQFGSRFNANEDIDFVIQKENTAGSPADRFVIASNGNVGIGTSAPGGSLHVSGSSSTFEKSEANGAAHELDFIKSRSGGIVQNGDNLAVLDFRGNDGVTHQRAAMIMAEVDGTPGADDMPGRLSFYTTTDGGIVSQERMRIDSDGNVGIGTTSPASPLTVKTSSTATGAGIARYVAGDNRLMHLLQPDNADDNSPFVWFTANAFQWRVDSVDAMTIDAAGRVGIGTTSPETTLHVDGGLCVTSDDTCGSLPANGQISAETTLNTGADYAEYFSSEDSNLRKGDLVGLNTQTGKVRAYQNDDRLIGIVSTNPGVIGNSSLQDKEDTVLVALVGQVPFNHNQVQVINGFAYALDQSPLGIILENGHVYINTSSADGEQNREIASLKLENEKLGKLFKGVALENQEIKTENKEIKKQLNDLKSMMCSIKPEAELCK